MGMRNPQVYAWLPIGLSDNREAMSSTAGDCRVLQNLIHDPTSKGVIAPRPGVTTLTAFPGFTTPGVVSGITNVGTRIYGMIATGRFADILSWMFIAVAVIKRFEEEGRRRR